MKTLRLGVFKFASCDGCQLQILNVLDELLLGQEGLDVAFFPEASSRAEPGPYDLAFVEGSITTAEDAERIRRLRQETETLVTIGACATAGGIQSLRNWADVEQWKRAVYPEPGWLAVLPTSTPISAHVKVDAEIHGCPVNEEQVLRLIARARLDGGADLPAHSVCMECKRRGQVCVLVARGTPCMGPVTRTGCGAICPGLDRGCYACFGPMDDPNPASLARRFEILGLDPREVWRRFRGITGFQPAFRRFTEATRGKGEPGDG